MKKIVKLITLLIILFSTTGCFRTMKKYYRYETDGLHYSSRDSRYNGWKKYIDIDSEAADVKDRESPIDYIHLRPNRSANYTGAEKTEILSDKVTVEYEGKKYSLPVIKKRSLLPFKSGVTCLKEGTIVYFGKVRVDDKFIIDMPPIRLKRYVEVFINNSFFDLFLPNGGTDIELYNGPLGYYEETYKETGLFYKNGIKKK